MKFTYRGFDRAGKALSGSVEAASEMEVREQLRGDGVFVAEIHADRAQRSGRSGKVLGTGKRLKCLTMFARQLHGLVVSGTPMVQALSAIERQAENETWKRVVAEVREKVEEGSALSEAMRHHQVYFDAVCRSLISAGESAGNMAAMLERLAALTRNQLKLRGAVVGALAYPCALVLIGIGVVILMLMFVLPRFQGLFEQLDTPLPPTTQAVVWASDALREYWWGALLAIGGGITALVLWLKSEAGRRWMHGAMLNAPKIGKLTRSLMTARLSRLLGILLESKVQVMEALELVKGSLTNVHYVELVGEAEDMVSRGEPLSAVLATSDLITPAVQEAIRNGEQTGQLGVPLLHMADFLDEENEMIVKSLTSLLEPLILVLLGIVVGFIALSMFMPLFDLTAMAGGGH